MALRPVDDGGSRGGNSVGEDIAERGMFTIDHPQYKLLADAITKRVAEVAAEKTRARSIARAIPMAVALTMQDASDVAAEYPEFALVNFGTNKPGHARWVVSRRLANEWVMSQASAYASNVCHVGGSVASYLLQEELEAQLIVDTSNPVDVHEHHAQTIDAFRYFRDFGAVSEELGRPISRVRYEEYLRGKHVHTIGPADEVAPAGAVLLDLTLRVIPPVQAAALMEQVGAGVAFGFVPYDSQMLVAKEGAFGNTGVHFERLSDGIALKYPEGAAGTTWMPYSAWEPWLFSHTFSIGSKGREKWFQLELLKTRGPFMFFRMVGIPEEPELKNVTHALDIVYEEPVYVVTVPELVSYDAKPDDPNNWRTAPFTVSQRVVDRAYNDAMQLERKQFTSYNVRKKITDANDRVVVNGTKVQLNTALGLDVLRKLTLAVCTRAFVDRYQVGSMTSEVMEVARRLHSRQRGRSSLYKRVMCAMAAYTYRPIARTFSGWVHDATQWVNDVFSDTSFVFPAEFREPMGYVRVGELCSSLTAKLSNAGPEVLLGTARPVPGSPGYELAMVAVGFFRGSVVGFEPGWSYLGASVASGSKGHTHVASQPPEVEFGDYRVSEESLFDDERTDDVADTYVDLVQRVNEVRLPAVSVRDITATVPLGEQSRRGPIRVDMVADPVGCFNEFYEQVNPGVGGEQLENDTASIALDPQDRYVVAPRLVLASDMSSVPRERQVYLSKIRALNVSKRQSTVQELFSAVASRNMSAPQVSLPMNEDAVVVDIWERFLNEACVADAKLKLARYQCDPVSLTEEGLRGWAASADPKKLERVIKAMEASGESLLEMDTGEYMMMLKSDVKPDLTRKPIFNRIEPQVIVYHKTELNALYSAIFRVLVRRFMSLLKPNYKVVLLKDMADVERVIQNVHPFGKRVKYLENDFSKYDKSQGRLVYQLEAYVFEQLGMNDQFLEHWLKGHKTARVRSVALGISLHVDYQRKSGDATTSFGNVLLNVLSVTYAYRGTGVLWAVFMGDDSLVCCSHVGSDVNAVKVLAEVFNLGSKTFVTDEPYFASHFLDVDDANAVVRFVPDPVKRIARWSMSVGAEDPNWHERWVSVRDACVAYLDDKNVEALPRLVSKRYDVGESAVLPAAKAIATVVASESKFRGLWEEKPVAITYG